MKKLKKYALISSYILFPIITLILGASTFFNIDLKNDIEKCKIPEIRLIAHTLINCPNSEGLKCTSYGKPHQKTYIWQACNSNWPEISSCPIIKTNIKPCTGGSFSRGNPHCVLGEWRYTSCVFISM